MTPEHARDVLQQKQQELQSRIQKIENDLKMGHSRDWEEQAAERQNDDVLDALAVEAKDELKRVQRALARIENHTYGICSRCGTAISEQRLRAVPETEYCVECA